MKEKTITITIDEQGSSTLDLDGFAGQGCEKVFDDFRGGDWFLLPFDFGGHAFLLPGHN
jgi:hypothetical protein